MFNITNKVAVVTGSSRGIGAGIAQLLAAQGAKVVVNHRNSPDGAEAVVAAIKDKGGEAVAKDIVRQRPAGVEERALRGTAIGAARDRRRSDAARIREGATRVAARAARRGVPRPCQRRRRPAP